jgi:hypothetical protein
MRGPSSTRTALRSSAKRGIVRRAASAIRIRTGIALVLYVCPDRYVALIETDITVLDASAPDIFPAGRANPDENDGILTGS